MCQTSGEKNALASDQAFGTEIRSNYGTDFGEAQGIFNSLNGNLESVIAKGPTGNIDTREVAAENAQAISNAAAANKNINASIRQKAALSGAAPGVESGATQGALANSEAKIENNLSNTEAGITQKAADVSRETYNTAVGNELRLPAATMDPTNQAASTVNAANETTGKQAEENAASSNSWMGLIGGIANAATGGIVKKLTGGNSSGGNNSGG